MTAALGRRARLEAGLQDANQLPALGAHVRPVRPRLLDLAVEGLDAGIGIVEGGAIVGIARLLASRLDLGLDAVELVTDLALPGTRPRGASTAATLDATAQPLDHLDQARDQRRQRLERRRRGFAFGLNGARQLKKLTRQIAQAADRMAAARTPAEEAALDRVQLV